jgi:hypothetical protein
MTQRYDKRVDGVASNAMRRRRVALSRVVEAAELLETRLLLSASVLTYHNDNASDGQNMQETVLTPSNVNSTSFGKVFTTSVDGQAYAQPLFVQGLNIAGGVHNVLFVATEHDSVYALDAGTGQVLWQDNMLTAAVSGLQGATSITTIPSADVFIGTRGVISPEIGITSTPVIDSSTNTIYLVAATKEMVSGVAHYVQQLFALNLATGAENYRMVNGQNTNSPATLGDTTFVNGVYSNNSPAWVNGTGALNDGNGHVFYNVMFGLQREALTLANGQVYFASGSQGDINPWHGFIVGFNASTLALSAVFCATPNGAGGDNWESGGKLAADSQGNLYTALGNGTFDGNNSTGTITGLNSAGFPAMGDYANTLIKLSVDTVHNSSSNQNINGWGLQVTDYFEPYNEAALTTNDRNLSGGAPLLLPASAGDTAHPNLLVIAGKQNVTYLLDMKNLGKFSANKADEIANIVEEIPSKELGRPIFGTPAYFNQQLYYVSQEGFGKSFSVPNGQAHIVPTPASVSPDSYGHHSATPSISANGTADGIVWTTNWATNELRAYAATGFNTELYTSSQAANNRDALGTAVPFSVPTVANGFVYLGTSNSIVAYGLLNPPASVPAASTSSVSNPRPMLSQATPSNASTSVASSVPADTRSAIPGSNDGSSTQGLDGLFATNLMKGSSAPVFVPRDSTQSPQNGEPKAAESGGLPVSAIDEFFGNF